MSDTPPTPPPPPPAPPAPPAQPDPLTQLDSWARSFASREKRDGKEQALKEVQTLLGCTAEEAKAKLDELEAKEREKLSEADRKLAEANDKDAKATKALEDAELIKLNAAIVVGLVGDGLDAAQAAHVADLVKVDVKGWDAEKVKDGIKVVREAFPQLFPQEEEGGTPPAGGVPPKPPVKDSKIGGGPPPPPAPTGAAADKAKARFLERHPEHARD